MLKQSMRDTIFSAFITCVLAENIALNLNEDTNLVKYENSTILGPDVIKELQLMQPDGAHDLAETVKKINAFVSEILVHINKYMLQHDNDPYKLQDILQTFEIPAIVGTITGKLGFYDGRLQGLASLHRIGDAIVLVQTSRVGIEMKIGLDALVFSMKYAAQFMGFGPSGSVRGSLLDVRMQAALLADKSGNVIYLHLDTIKLHTVSKMEVKFSCNILIDWIINLLSNVILSTLRPIIVNVGFMVIRHLIIEVVEEISGSLEASEWGWTD